MPSPRLASVTGQSPATAPLRARPSVSASRHMGGVDQAPARIDTGMIEQPFDRPRARPGEAGLDFLHLLGGVDVHRPAFGQRNDLRQFLGRDGAQANAAQRRCAHPAEPQSRARLAPISFAKRLERC